MDFCGRPNSFGLSKATEACLRNMILFSSCEDDDDDEPCSDDLMSDCSSASDINIGPQTIEDKLKEFSRKTIEANKNAESLIAEEEKARKKAEKRRAKKKKRKEKKRQQKEKEEQGASNLSHDADEKSSSPSKNASDVEEEALDLESAFVAGKKKLADAKSKKLVTKQEESVQQQPSTEDRVHQGEAYARKGFDYASKGFHKEAIKCFSDAIRMDPTDYRYFGNRSYCYERLGNFKRALHDANRAIELRADWPKGHFRKGVALKGLKNYMEAEKSFAEVLRLDEKCTDAVEEIFSLQKTQIVEMGFSTTQAELALRHCRSVPAALEFLLSERHKNEANKSLEIYVSDDEDDESDSPPFSPSLISELTKNHSDEKMDPRNPEGMLSLWVGNIKQEVSEKSLKELFSKYGKVVSVRMLPDRFCAFVNYKDKFSAGRAMAALQGKELCGQEILIRYPDNPLTTNGVMMLKKKKTGTNTTESAKPTQPVNGNECYYWRTTGCAYGKNCRYNHIAKHKGIDRT